MTENIWRNANQSPLPSPREVLLPFVFPSLVPLAAAAEAKLVGS